MIKDLLQVYSLSVVFVGDFNPIIIQPFWLSSKKLIREQEAEKAIVDLIHPELVRFNIDWAHFEITPIRFEIRSTQEPYFEAVRDLGLSIFEILKETPIKMLGINHNRHYALDNEDRYYAFGNKLAPLANWDKIFKKPRLINLEMVDDIRDDDHKGMYRIRVQPSDIVSSINFGISISLNDHYDFSESKDKYSELSKILKQDWNNSFYLANQISENLWLKVTS